MRLKVWGGMSHFSFVGQRRAIIATTSKKRAAQLLGMSLYEFNNYWVETGNEQEIRVAMEKPETVFMQERVWVTRYKETKR